MMMRLAEFRKDKAKRRQLFAIWKDELITVGIPVIFWPFWSSSAIFVLLSVVFRSFSGLIFG